jgi:putative two-component system response regulator
MGTSQSTHGGLPAAINPEARLLVVDDEEANLRLMEITLRRAGYQRLQCVGDAREVIGWFEAWQPDLVLLDVRMPYLDGIEVLCRLQPLVPDSMCLPFIMLTADYTVAVKLRALAAGATDFLTKPFSPIELLLRIQTHLRTRFLYLELEQQKLALEERVRVRTRDLEEAQLEILERLALAAEYRDDATGQHAQRVGHLSALIARKLGWPHEQVELIRRAALLHDLGKIGIPDAVLLKRGRYSADEYRQMQAHTEIGSRIVAGSRSPLLRLVEQVARSHHECWDGTGYSPGCGGESIPLPGRIVAVADVFDALTQERPYKSAWPVAAAIEEIRRKRGQQFDPAVVDAFLHVVDEHVAHIRLPQPRLTPTGGRPVAV